MTATVMIAIIVIIAATVTAAFPAPEVLWDTPVQQDHFLSAYSASSQTTKSGESLKFAANAVTNGSAITHTPGSADFTIQQTGFYRATFHGTLYPTKESNLPLTITLTQNLQGSGIPGGQTIQMFHTSTTGENVAFSQFFRVTVVPSTFNIVGTGGIFFCFKCDRRARNHPTG
ncbi:MAG: hypothetical protein DBX58_06230 [Clostridiales bacterium]|nr:MAG: hypothetical protein DBX58_06230 [Clostridiales bacterium]